MPLLDKYTSRNGDTVWLAEDKITTIEQYGYVVCGGERLWLDIESTYELLIRNTWHGNDYRFAIIGNKWWHSITRERQYITIAKHKGKTIFALSKEDRTELLVKDYKSAKILVEEIEETGVFSHLKIVIVWVDKDGQVHL